MAKTKRKAAPKTTGRARKPHVAAADRPTRRGRPRHIIIFQEPSDKNASRLSKVVGAGQAKGKTRSRSGLLQLRARHEGHAATLVYERLGIAVADLSQEECNALESSNEVEAVVPNLVRRIPPVIELNKISSSQASPLDAQIPSDSTMAFLKGLHFAAGLALKARESNGVSLAERSGPQSAATSWCLQMLGMGPGYTKATGKGVTVAVLDTGIDLDHPDFAGRFTEPGTAVSFYEGEDVRDLDGHGTHCAGVIAGPRVSTSGMRYGVAPEVNLLVGKVLGGPRSEGYDDDIVNAIDWAAERGARIISLSLGSERRIGGRFSRLYEQTASSLARKPDGCLLVAAAGNSSDRPEWIAAVENPAACPSLMAVGALDLDRLIAFFSCGSVDSVAKVDIAAPGVDVKSAWVGGGFETISGTSMATPHVAGVAALYLELEPKLTPLELWKKLTSNARRAGIPRDFGAGLVQVP